jgi:hypothetical protein
MNAFVVLPLIAVGCFLMGQGCPHPRPRRQRTFGIAIVAVSVLIATALLVFALGGHTL